MRSHILTIMTICLWSLIASGCSILRHPPDGTTEAPKTESRQDPVVIIPIEQPSAPDEAEFSPLKEWPDDAPPQEVFQVAYEADTANQNLQSREDYLGWVARFYAGVTLVPGWSEVTERVLEDIPDDQKVQIEYRLQALGRNVAGEWAKDNSVRMIDSRMVSVWRDGFLQSLKNEKVLDFLSLMEDDVAELLNGELEAGHIVRDRYFEPDRRFDF